MPIEQINNPNAAASILEALAKKHDQLIEEAAEHEEAIILLRKKSKTNREKKYLFTDKTKAEENEQEFNDLAEGIAWREAELSKIWKKINEIQTKILEAKKI